MEMERFQYRAREEDLGVAFVLDQAKAFERVSLFVVWAWATHFSFLEEDIAGAVWLLRAPEASAVRRMCGGATPDHHGHLAGVNVELLTSPYCAAGRSECYKNFPAAEVEGLCG